CDRPREWCDVHHIVHWVDGGETKLSNLELRCRLHHRDIHEGRRARAP
ncbi:MAG TPA: HNH endonuclease signature motif containing protein, partial [Acidimicrobiia bacterium]